MRALSRRGAERPGRSAAARGTATAVCRATAVRHAAWLERRESRGVDEACRRQSVGRRHHRDFLISGFAASAVRIPDLKQRKRGRHAMKRQALFLGVFTAAMLALPAFGADGAPGMMEFRWGKNAFNFEPTPSGPQPLRNLSAPPEGTANAGPLVGDYH